MTEDPSQEARTTRGRGAYDIKIMYKTQRDDAYLLAPAEFSNQIHSKTPRHLASSTLDATHIQIYTMDSFKVSSLLQYPHGHHFSSKSHIVQSSLLRRQ